MRAALVLASSLVAFGCGGLGATSAGPDAGSTQSAARALDGGLGPPPASDCLSYAAHSCSVDSDCPPPPFGCSSVPCCRQAQCTVDCVSPPEDTLPACADAGGNCGFIPPCADGGGNCGGNVVVFVCNSLGPPNSCAYADETCCLTPIPR